jgi:hypothetical protein
MMFPYGETVFRDRRKPVIDPYDPEHEIPGSWDDPLDTIEIDNATIGPSSSTAVPDAARTQILTYKSLYCYPNADVRSGDRVRVGSETYDVNERPDAVKNPFTGWEPFVEIPLKLAEG